MPTKKSDSGDEAKTTPQYRGTARLKHEHKELTASYARLSDAAKSLSVALYVLARDVPQDGSLPCWCEMQQKLNHHTLDCNTARRAVEAYIRA